MPETSIIIRAFNEEKHLPVLLDALATQTYDDFEVVVVDSGSFDRTREIARQRAERLVRIKPDDFTFGYSLNAGIQHSTGRFIVVVSAHTLPIGTDWLVNLISPLREERVAMVYGQQRGRADSKFGEYLDFERNFGTERQLLMPPNFFANNANSAVQRGLWEQHPFDETLPGLEDIEWAKYWMEQGYHVLYEPAAGICHLHDESWAQVRHRYYREGQAAKWIGILRRRNIPSEVGQEALFFLGDLAQAWRQHSLHEKAAEIMRFRFEKLVGTIAGIWDGALMENPMTRGQLLYDKPYQAVLIHGPGTASLEHIQLAVLKPGEVLVRVAYEGICATDLEILDGQLGYYKNGLAQYPIVPGHELSGTIAGVGARVTECHDGDRVVVECIQGCGKCPACQKGNAIGCVDRHEVGVIQHNGGYAEYMVTAARFVHRLPETVTLKKACLCEPLAVVLKGLRRLERIWTFPNEPRTCAVVGGGTIGHLAARVLQKRGHQVTVFDRDWRRREYFNGSGIYTNDDLRDLAAFDAIVEATGDPDALDSILHNSAAGSTLLLLGLPYAKRNFSFEAIVGYDKTIVGSVGSNADDFVEALAILPHLDTTAFMEKVLPLAEFQTAWEISRAHEHLKVILRVDSTV